MDTTINKNMVGVRTIFFGVGRTSPPNPSSPETAQRQQQRPEKFSFAQESVSRAAPLSSATGKSRSSATKIQRLPLPCQRIVAGVEPLSINVSPSESLGWARTYRTGPPCSSYTASVHHCLVFHRAGSPNCNGTSIFVHPERLQS